MESAEPTFRERWVPRTPPTLRYAAGTALRSANPQAARRVAVDPSTHERYDGSPPAVPSRAAGNAEGSVACSGARCGRAAGLLRCGCCSRRPPCAPTIRPPGCRSTTSTSCSTPASASSASPKRSPGSTAAPPPSTEIVFNAHAAYKIPDKDIGLLAKMLEILRVSPREGMTADGAPHSRWRPPTSAPQWHGAARSAPARRAGRRRRLRPVRLRQGQPDRPRDPAAQGDRAGPIRHRPPQLHRQAPPKERPLGSVGRHHHAGPMAPRRRRPRWHPLQARPLRPLAPALLQRGRPLHRPRHPPQAIRSSPPPAPNAAPSDLDDGWKAIEFEPAYLRDFALIASARFQEKWGEADGVKVRCLAPAGT